VVTPVAPVSIDWHSHHCLQNYSFYHLVFETSSVQGQGQGEQVVQLSSYFLIWLVPIIDADTC